MEERVLETHHVPESHRATNLGDALYSTAEIWVIIRDYGIHTVVTDNASNVITVVVHSGIDPYIACFAHYLNLVVWKLWALKCYVYWAVYTEVILQLTLKEKQVQLALARSVAKAKN